MGSKRHRNLVFVAERDLAIVGGALTRLLGDCVKVDVVALEPGVRRRGIGRQLMKAIEAEGVRLGARMSFLGGANADNRGLCTAWASWGGGR